MQLYRPANGANMVKHTTKTDMTGDTLIGDQGRTETRKDVGTSVSMYTGSSIFFFLCGYFGIYIYRFVHLFFVNWAEQVGPSIIQAEQMGPFIVCPSRRASLVGCCQSYCMADSSKMETAMAEQMGPAKSHDQATEAK